MSYTEQRQEEYAQREIASMARMSDADLQYWVDRITKARAVPLYALKVSSADSDRDFDLLYRCRNELARRKSLTLIHTHSNTEAA